MDPSGVPGEQPAGVLAADTPYTILKALGWRIQTHNAGLSRLFSKANALKAAMDKIRSDPAKIAIHELLAVVKGLRGSKEEVSRAYNNAATTAKNAEQNSVPDPPSIPLETLKRRAHVGGISEVIESRGIRLSTPTR